MEPTKKFNDWRAELSADFPATQDEVLIIHLAQSHLMRIQVLLHERMTTIEFIAERIVESSNPLKGRRLVKLSEDRELTKANLLALTEGVQPPVK